MPDELLKGEPGGMPEGAVSLTEEEVMKLQNRVIENWEPPSQMNAIKYGSLICGGTAFMSGAIFNSHFRQYLKLATRARASTYLASGTLPFITIAIFHEVTVSQPLRMGRLQCPTCAEVRATTTQLAFGVAQPLGLALLGSVTFARNYRTVALPSIFDVPGWKKEIPKMLRPVKSSLFLLVAMNVFTAALVTHKEGRLCNLIHQKMADDYGVYPRVNL